MGRSATVPKDAMILRRLAERYTYLFLPRHQLSKELGKVSFEGESPKNNPQNR
jgi:hypothetical protein